MRIPEVEKVYDIVDSELEYQANRWNNGSLSLVCAKDAEKSVAEWINYMEYHLSKAKEKVYFLDKGAALDEIRKVTALGINTMVHNKTLSR